MSISAVSSSVLLPPAQVFAFLVSLAVHNSLGRLHCAKEGVYPRSDTRSWRNSPACSTASPMKRPPDSLSSSCTSARHRVKTARRCTLHVLVRLCAKERGSRRCCCFTRSGFLGLTFASAFSSALPNGPNLCCRDRIRRSAPRLGDIQAASLLNPSTYTLRRLPPTPPHECSCALVDLERTSALPFQAPSSERRQPSSSRHSSSSRLNHRSDRPLGQLENTLGQLDQLQSSETRPARVAQVALAAPPHPPPPPRTRHRSTRAPRRTCAAAMALQAGAPDRCVAPGSAAVRGGATPSPSGHSLAGLTPGLGAAFHTRQCMDCAGDVRAPAVLLAPETPPVLFSCFPQARSSTLAHAPPRPCASVAGLTRAVACRPSPPRARPGPRSLSSPLQRLSHRPSRHCTSPFSFSRRTTTAVVLRSSRAGHGPPLDASTLV